MTERGRGRYDRSQYGSNARSDRGANYDSPSRRAARERIDAGKVEQATRVAEHETANAEAAYAEAARKAAELEASNPTRRSYSRAAVEDRVAQEASQKRSKGHGLRIALIVLLVLVVVGGGAAFAYVNSISNNLHEGVDDELLDALVPTDMGGEPFYMLLLGTDASEFREETGETDSVYRTDSMILARIDPVNKKATLVSIGRDITVNMGEYGQQKINAAYAFGGAAYAVQVVSEFAGVPISHYAEVDFDGFRAIVDSLGGVEVDVPVEIDDPDAGGYVPAGPQTLDGYQALALCRSRNSYAYTAARPDDMRTANQRLVLGAIARKLLASDIATIASSVQAMSAYVTTDLGLNDIIGLAQVMRGLDPETDLYTASVPCETQIIDGGYYDFVTQPDWDNMMKRIDAGLPPTEEAVVDEVTGTVLATSGSGTKEAIARTADITVKNATDIDGLATNVRKQLLEAGYKNVTIGDVTPGYSYPNTLVLYDEPGRVTQAEDIVSIIGQGQALENDGSYLLLDCDLLVVIGDDWES
jgi:LCP family protein required for cell wall assembly